MVFEDRNTTYGAYKLRKDTGRRYGKALGCLGAILLAVLTPIIAIMLLFALPEQTYDITKDITRLDGVRIKEARPQRRPEKKSEPEMSDEAAPQIEDIDPHKKCVHQRRRIRMDQQCIHREDRAADHVDDPQPLHRGHQHRHDH